MIDRIDIIAEYIEETLRTAALTHGLSRSFRNALTEIHAYRSHQRGITKWKAGSADADCRRVQLGGGAHVLPDFLNIDITPPVDLVCDAREGLPLDDGAADFVFSEHFLEHVDYPRSAKHIVAEIHRVLRPGGHTVIGVPDGQLVLAGYAAGDTSLYYEMIQRWYPNRDCLDHFNTYIDLVNYVFRDQEDHSTYTPHYWAYDHDKLVSLCAEVGFKLAEPWQLDPEIANPKRRWGTIYIVATK